MLAYPERLFLVSNRGNRPSSPNLSMWPDLHLKLNKLSGPVPTNKDGASQDILSELYQEQQLTIVQTPRDLGVLLGVSPGQNLQKSFSYNILILLYGSLHRRGSRSADAYSIEGAVSFGFVREHEGQRCTMFSVVHFGLVI